MNIELITNRIIIHLQTVHYLLQKIIYKAKIFISKTENCTASCQHDLKPVSLIKQKVYRVMEVIASFCLYFHILLAQISSCVILPVCKGRTNCYS